VCEKQAVAGGAGVWWPKEGQQGVAGEVGKNGISC
jgi:hypothetical protein